MKAEKLKRLWAKLKKPVIYTLYALMALAVALYVYNAREDFGALLTANPWQIALLLAICFVTTHMPYLSRKISMEMQGVKLALVDYLGMPAVRSLLVYVLPLRADLVLSAAYYKRKCGVTYASFASVIAVENLLAIFVWLLAGMGGLLSAGLRRGVWPWPIWAGMTLLCALIAAAVLITLRLPEGRRKNKVAVFISDAIAGFQLMAKRTGKVFALALLALIHVFINVSLYYAAYAILGYRVEIDSIIVFSVINMFSDVLIIVPGNLGVREALTGFAAFLMGDGFGAGLQATLLMRASGILMHLLIGLCWAYPVHRELKKLGISAEGGERRKE